ncbi:hypothetical protein V5F44_15580 [Xanthobacter sp. V2C-8]|uniref:hypothetical protein n=1 Tax=Xanthobacter albus TaxID=3119929 RepID=UPI00372CAACA
MTWQPPARDMDPREMILSAAVRVAIARHPDGCRADAWQELASGGMRLTLRLAHAPQQRIAYNGRAALMYAVSGEVLEGRQGHSCEGSAVLDLKTRAFLNVDCRLVPTGRVAPEGWAP